MSCPQVRVQKGEMAEDGVAAARIAKRLSDEVRIIIIIITIITIIIASMLSHEVEHLRFTLHYAQL